MEPLGGLLRRRPGQEGPAFVAAMVVETANSVIHDTLRLTENDARATSVRNREVRVVVAHGAIAGIIQQRADELLEKINTRLQRGSAAPRPVERIITRVSL